MAVPNLTRDDARARADLLHVESYDVRLDLTDGGGKPSERTFRSTTTIVFSARAGEETFVDVIADAFHEVTLNGAAVDVSGYRHEDGIRLAGLAEQNTLVVDADCLYTNTGEGLHRFVDPIDGETYLYSQFETADAKRMYACFDQPDLKATFTFHVTAPEHWEVSSNGRVERTEELPAGTLLHFATTARISPYITALVAGPYHVVRDHHDGIDLGLWCRKTLAEHLDADELFLLTRQGFDWYHANFGVRYAFDKYDQLFVPEFNAGAMENAGCVTFREDYVFRSKVTDARYERRGETLLHEMAHMWFGDLVTMRWWDDLWLNESFATFASVLCQTRATRWTDAWATFANAEKTWAYRQDQLPSTHPIATDAPDVQTAEVNFDGITYAKGASVLKQLSAYVGVDEFLAGVRDYFAEHAYGNTTLADLLRALEKSSGRELGEWSKLWLETSGINTLRPEFTLDADGRYASFDIVQTAPTEVATSNTLRPHRLAVGCYEPRDGRLVRTARVEMDVVGERTPVPELVGEQPPEGGLLLVNDDDLTYCKQRLGAESLRTLLDGGIAKLDSPLARALCWSAAWDMTRDGELPTRDYVALVVAGAEHETDIGVMQSLTRQALRALEIYADPQWAPQGYAALADAAVRALGTTAPGSDHQLAWVHALLGSARTDEHVAFVRGLLDGSTTPDGLAVDDELRWSVLSSLVVRGAAGEAEIAAELERDPSAAGRRHAATARAARPSPAAKEEAWQLAVHDDTLPNAMQEAVIGGFAPASQGELVAPYVERYFADILDVWHRRTSELAQNVVVGLFPTWSSTIAQATVAAADAFLAGDDVPPALRRLVGEGRADVVRALRARATDTAAG
ncbi:Membrane alanyl aminopeptidase Metallo peptidase. MEROPS family M01 [Jatrophihabitans endophyticus]|uniref:Aminopeptidase N n=1 Tax=Jatrophihabitans endophyticus TaxID=1206085 RepID=A0A1M5PMH4_9ACTN|nr:aminopeptidase N [Jatrophihabitans endophyticus]SHH02954.1 Membrane alanyl aminopeptidase Metallo peptidase. MEROPS family M01 [Jatrophihabitans endophyticus]